MGDVQNIVVIKVEKASRAMSAPLREKCEEVRALLTAARDATSSARYRIGAVVEELKRDPAKYGANAVELLAQTVGRSASVLYGYASVVQAWEEQHFRALAERKSVHGIPLSFSHFVLIALAKRSSRQPLVERALAEGLSVPDLRRLMGRAGKPTREPHVPGSVSTPHALLADYVRAADAQIQRLDNLRLTVRQIGREPSTPKLAALLEAALASQKSLRDLADRNTQEISRELTRVRAAIGRVAPSAI